MKTTNVDSKSDPNGNIDKDVEYNPFDHRNLAKGNSDIRSVANLIKSSLGSGLLAMPLAFSNAGWLVGIISTVVISAVCAHCVHILVKVSRECCKQDRQPLLDYANTCESAFANGPARIKKYAATARVFADFATTLTYLSICCVYIILIADSLKQLVDRYFPDHVYVVELYCLALILPLALIGQVRSLKWLAPFSMLSNVLIILIFFICLYYVFSDAITLEGRRPYNHLSRYPAFLSTVIFALEGVGVVMPTENSMKRPQHFLGCPSVLVVAMGLITFMYSMLGIFGYLRFGDEVMGSITLNLPLNDWPAIVAKVFVILAVFFTFPLHFFVGMDILWKHLQRCFGDNYKSIAHTIMRSLIIVGCGAIAVALPLLEQILAIVGGFFFSVLGLIIPAVLETVFCWDRDPGTWNWRLWKNLLVILFGFMAMTTGCAVAISDIVTIIHSRE